jgi:hypothetical protein
MTRSKFEITRSLDLYIYISIYMYMYVGMSLFMYEHVCKYNGSKSANEIIAEPVDDEK